MIDVVFFDAGETLLGPDPSWSELSARVLRDRGHDVDALTMREAWRQGADHFRSAAEQGWVISASAADSEAFWTGLYTELLAHAGIEDADAPEALYRTFSDPRSYRLFADAVPALEALRERGHRLGVISNFEGWLADLLEMLGIAGLFEVTAISGPLGWEKPDPRIFKWALEEAGADASACVYVGDQPYFDAEPAIALGMHGVLIDRHGRWVDLDPPYPKISTLGELAGVVEGLET